MRDSKGRILLVKHKPERDSLWQRESVCPGGKFAAGSAVGRDGLA